MQKRRPEKVVFRLRFDSTASKKDTPMGRIPICRHPVAVPSECPRLSKAFVPRCPFVVPGRNFACQSRLVSCRPRHTLHLPLTLPLAAGKFVSAATRSGRSSRHRRRSHRSPYGRFPGALWYFLARKKVHTPKHTQKRRSLSAPPFISRFYINGSMERTG